MTSPYGSLAGMFRVTQGDPVHAIEGRKEVRQPRTIDRLFSRQSHRSDDQLTAEDDHPHPVLDHVPRLSSLHLVCDKAGSSPISARDQLRDHGQNADRYP